MRTQFYTASSLDGFLATEDDSLDWLFAIGELSTSSYPAFIAEVGAGDGLGNLRVDRPQR